MRAISIETRNCNSAPLLAVPAVCQLSQLGQTFAQDGNPSLVEELGDKVLTFLFSACANILNRFEDFMVRQNGRRSSSPGALIRKTTPVPAWINTTTAFPRIPASVLTFLTLILALTLPAFAQTPDVDDIHISPRVETDKSEPANAGDADTLRTHSPMITKKVDLVLVPVTVTDPMNRLVTGLDKDNFQVYEGKEQQDLRHFSSEDAPISLGVIFDMSGSMSSKIERAREAVTEFFRTANPQDEFFLIAFADKPEEISDFTQSIDDLQGKLIYTVPKGRTALLDAIYLGVSKMRQAKYPKKALLIISDGGDNHSRYTEGEIKSLVKEADVMVYSIGIYDHYFATEEERLGPGLLSDVSELSGGRSFTIDNPNDLADVATKIGIELRNQYVLGYRPRNPGHDGKWHKIKIKLLPPKGLPPLHVYAKTGYYASSQ
jgi:Ca-activated chloride channel family protein